ARLGVMRFHCEGYGDAVDAAFAQSSSPTAPQTASPSDLPVASALPGTFIGSLSVGPASLTIVYHITLAEDGTLSASMDSPDQGAYGIPFDSVEFNAEDRSLTLPCKLVNGHFNGTLSEDGTSLEGAWTQMGNTLPLTLTRGELEKPKRPQMPAPPYPYIERAVTIERTPAQGETQPTFTLAGTLTLPTGAASAAAAATAAAAAAPFPAIIFITGSGAQDRDESLMGHKPFLVIADALTRAGFATLRLDDRGVGGSTGSMATATSHDLVYDTAAALEWLKVQPEIDPTRIGLLGHSEGGMIAPMLVAHLAAQSAADPTAGVAATTEPPTPRTDIAFMVLLAGPGTPCDQLLVEQTELIARAAGAPEEVLATQRDLMNQCVAWAKDPTISTPDLIGRMRAAVLAQGEPIPPEAQPALEQQFQAMASPWMRAFLAYDPTPALSVVTCPTLALFGERDLQVPAASNAPAMRAALAHNPRAVVETVPAANHLFQPCETGGIDEYTKIELTIDPVVLDRVTRFLRSAAVSGS
ncbi:MAG: alpha/beta fold hydrolase, partial [Planctomycetota bacterium]|nr:alpha/beta fold hydrolase [Planctomycetota bacterium]